MKIYPEIKPFVFVTVRGNETVLIAPGKSHTAESWVATTELIQNAYIKECILKNDRGAVRGAEEVVQMLERHPEFDCDFMQIERMLSWQMPGGD
ncbi:MAG: hypothetical protein KBD10_00500 [Candidatus Pacebacteria bacterium]|nr:hypothetical protein [Candidatus Paceibacterota bacterium]